MKNNSIHIKGMKIEMNCLRFHFPFVRVIWALSSLQLNMTNWAKKCIIPSKINDTTQRCLYLPISKLHSILAVANLLAHNDTSKICCCGQISLQSAAVNCSFCDNLTHLGVTFILLAMVPNTLPLW